MSDLRLTRRQRNDVALVVADEGFALAEFSWDTIVDDGNRCSRLTHLGTGGVCVFTQSFDGELQVAYSPGLDRRSTREDTYSWQVTLARVIAWLGNVRAEDVPDLWDASRNELVGLVEASDHAGDAPFTDDEQASVRSWVTELQARIDQLEAVSPAARASARSQLDYLVDVSARQTRRDWIIMLSGTLINVAVTLNLPIEETRVLFGVGRQFLRAIGWA